MSFLTIVPRDNIYLTRSIGAIPLRITRNGVDTTPDDNITVTNLNTKDNWKYKHFYNTGDGGISFKVEVLLKDTDIITTLNGEPIYGEDFKVLTALKYFIANRMVLSVQTSALDVPNDTYIITKNSSRKQTHDHNTVWELEFTTFKGITTYKFKTDTSDVTKSVTAAKAAAKNAKLKKCNYKTLKYSKKKKIVKCVKYMQKVLYKNKLLKKKQITGWFDKTTKKAVKKFQKKWNKTHVKAKTTNTVNSSLVTVNSGSLVTNTNNSNISLPAGTTLSSANTNTGSTTVKITGLNKLLRTDGKVDKATWKALCES